MTKIALIAAAILAVLCAFMGWRWDSTRTSLEAAEALNTGLTAQVQALQKLRDSEQKLAQKYASQNAVLKEQQRKTDAELKSALSQNPAWSDERVPAGVADALRM